MYFQWSNHDCNHITVMIAHFCLKLTWSERVLHGILPLFWIIANNCKFTLIWPDIVRLMIPESKYAVMCQHRVGTCISRPMPVRFWHNVAYAPHAHAPEVYWHRHHGDEISCRPFLYYWPFCLWTAASQHRGLVMLCESLLFSLLYAYIIHSAKSKFLGKIWSVATINRIASIIW